MIKLINQVVAVFSVTFVVKEARFNSDIDTSWCTKSFNEKKKKTFSTNSWEICYVDNGIFVYFYISAGWKHGTGNFKWFSMHPMHTQDIVLISK